MSRTVGAALTAVAALSVTAATTRATVGSAPGVIVTDVGGQIVAVNADGSGVRALTHPNPLKYESDENPVPSPDGSLIVFDRAGARSRVMMVRADGTGLRTIADAMLNGAEWSPDGSQLALETTPNFELPKTGGPVFVTFESGISIVAPDGNGSELLVGKPEHHAIGFSWSPDGKSIAYTGQDTIAIADVESGARRVLVKMANAWRPAWSPDGARIAFLAGNDLYVTSASGGNSRRLAKDLDAGTPVWSPDGTRLAFTLSNYPKPSAVVVVDAASGRVTARIPALAGGGSAAPSWSPNGSRLMFLRARAPGDFADVDGDVWIADANGSQALQLTRSFPFGGSHSTAHWLTGIDAIAPDPKPATTLLRPSTSLRLPGGYQVVAVNGRTAAVIRSSDSSSGPALGVWRGGGPIHWIKAATADRVALTGNRIYWSWYGSDRSESATELWTSTWPNGRPIRLARHTGDPGGPALMVAGDPSFIVYSYQGTLWRLSGSRAAPIRHERSTYLEPLSVDKGRVLLWNGRVLEIVNAQGRLLATVPPGADPVAAQLSAQRVILLDRSQSIVRRLPEQTRVATWPVGAPGLAEGAGLGHGTLFPYGTENGYGSANYRLLDLASGRDTILALPGGMSPTSVAIGSGGLFYTAVPPYRGVKGQIGFLPLPRVDAALGGT
jgi:WD40-like Beta Propeller Repeat